MKMLTPLEESLLEIMKTLKVDWETIVGIMLMLKENKVGQNTLLEYLKDNNPKDLNQSIIVKKVTQIVLEK